MSTSFLKRGAMFVLCGCLATAAPARAEDRPAGKILAEINAVEMPKLPEDRTDQSARRAYNLQRQKAMEQKADLIGELFKANPNAPELAKLLPERWLVRMLPGAVLDQTRSEIEKVLSSSKDEKLRNEAAMLKLLIAFQKAGQNARPQELMPVFEEFARAFPKDPRGALALARIANLTQDEGKKAELMKRLEKDYPESPTVKALAGPKKQREGVGKPFEFEFTDAIKGTQVSMASLKGKVVVFDFWATWCGPCVEEMPNMKKLYADYKDKGVEFVGVSLDQPRESGGFDALKAFVEKNKVEWPQYYEGKTSASDFATEWGITAIPTVFLIDADGNLASTKARGKLEELLPEYLEKAKAKKSAVN